MPVGKRRTPPPTKKGRLLPSIESTQRSLSGDVDALRRHPMTFGSMTVWPSTRNTFAAGCLFTPFMVFPDRPFKAQTLALYGAGVSASRQVSAAIYRQMLSEVLPGKWIIRKVADVEAAQTWDTTLAVRQYELTREITFDGKSGLYWVGVVTDGNTSISTGTNDSIQGCYTYASASLASELGYGGLIRADMTRSTNPSIHARLIPSQVRRILCD